MAVFNINFAYSIDLECSIILTAEMYAILFELKHPLEEGITRIIIETDY